MTVASWFFSSWNVALLVKLEGWMLIQQFWEKTPENTKICQMCQKAYCINLFPNLSFFFHQACLKLYFLDFGGVKGHPFKGLFVIWKRGRMMEEISETVFICLTKKVWNKDGMFKSLALLLLKSTVKTPSA